MSLSQKLILFVIKMYLNMNPSSWNISWRLDSEWGVSPAASLPQELPVPIFCSIFSTKAKSLPSLPLTTLWWRNAASCPSAPVLPVGEQFELPTKPPRAHLHWEESCSPATLPALCSQFTVLLFMGLLHSLFPWHSQLYQQRGFSGHGPLRCC